MEPERFDDVAFRVIEEPEPPGAGRGQRRPGRLPLVLAACALAACGLSSAAQGMTGSSAAAAPAASHQAPRVTLTKDGVPMVRSGPACLAGRSGPAHERRRSSSPRY